MKRHLLQTFPNALLPLVKQEGLCWVLCLGRGRSQALGYGPSEKAISVLDQGCGTGPWAPGSEGQYWVVRFGIVPDSLSNHWFKAHFGGGIRARLLDR